MKRTNFILNGFLALATVLVFAQCTDKNNNASTTSTAAPAAAGAAGSSNMKIAYVEIDSLLTKYNFWNDLNEMMIKKEENIRTTLNEKAKKLDAEAKEFQRKYENNGFASPERAQQEYQRIQKQQQDLGALQQKLSDELASENQKNSLQLRDSINSFLKMYNKDKGYDLIISNTGFDNLLYANPAYNITQEIISGLNARYTPSAKK
ncbi:OmpH family outer membrane protein [Phocaeicola sp.]